MKLVPPAREPAQQGGRISGRPVLVDPALVVPDDDPRLAPGPQGAFEAFRAQRRFPALDGIRGFSILAVIWHHTAEGIGGFAASTRGFLGVDAFFVLSGFLIVTLCLRERDRTGDISLRRFYARRTLRIFPIYYLLLATVLLFVLVAPSSSMHDAFLRELPFHATYTSNWIKSATFLAITWSLATEEQFYLLWPPVEKLLRKRAVPILLAVLCVNQLVNFGVLDELLENGLGLARADYAILQVTFTPICLGVLLAHMLHARGSFERLHALLAGRWAPWLVLAALAVACSVPGDLTGWPRLAIQVGLGLFIAASVLEERHPLARLCSLRPLRWIGAISYGMYLYHHVVRHVAGAVLHEAGLRSPCALFLATALSSIAVATVSFRCIEQPLLRRQRGAVSA